MNLVFDCDNTFGVNNCDIDDGLALLYLLGNENVNVLGITCTFGNSNINIVYNSTKELLERLNINIPIYKGGGKSGEYHSSAVDFLLEMSNKYDDLCILATGSLTNIYGAYLKDNNFFQNKQVFLMGGITEKLFINNYEIKELNFSCDYLATFNVLKECKDLWIVTGNNCLDAYFDLEGFKAFIKENNLPKYFIDNTLKWYERNNAIFNINGFYNWDVCAAVLIFHSEMFHNNSTNISPTLESLKEGMLISDGEEIRANLPTIKNIGDFQKNVYASYLNFFKQNL